MLPFFWMFWFLCLESDSRVNELVCFSLTIFKSLVVDWERGIRLGYLLTYAPIS